MHDAEYVVSNSFHGVAFSLIFQKQVFAVGMGEKANRVRGLFDYAGIPQRYVDDHTINLMKLSDIDHDEVRPSLTIIISASKQYLSKSIEK